jgi:polyribonucleotide nucleotidyltransferase
MDIKIEGLSYDIMSKALDQAKEGRMQILNKMLETIAEPRAELKPHTPRIVQITIPKDMIGAVIGPGGKIIQEIQEKTNSTITITEEGGSGVVDIFSENQEDIEAALDRIKGIIEVPEAGKEYTGIVKSVMPYGAFVEILPGKEGLLHISEIEWRRLEKVEEVLKEGDEVKVKLLDIDPRSGKLKLSRKALLPKPERKKE